MDEEVNWGVGNASWRPQFGEAHTALQSHSVIEPVSHTLRHHPSSGILYYTMAMFLCFIPRILNWCADDHCEHHLSHDAKDIIRHNNNKKKKNDNNVSWAEVIPIALYSPISLYSAHKSGTFILCNWHQFQWRYKKSACTVLFEKHLHSGLLFHTRKPKASPKTCLYLCYLFFAPSLGNPGIIRRD